VCGGVGQTLDGWVNAAPPGRSSKATNTKKKKIGGVKKIEGNEELCQRGRGKHGRGRIPRLGKRREGKWEDGKGGLTNLTEQSGRGTWGGRQVS